MSAAKEPMSKADYVYGLLSKEIRNAEIAGGTPLRAAAVAERLGVSITPVREAFRRLERDRLITYERHQGATVIDLTDDALLEFYRVRAVVEGLGARLAAAAITEPQLQELTALHDAMVKNEREGRHELLGEQSRRFHLAITDIGGPSFLGEHARALHDSHSVPAGASLWLDPDQAKNQLIAHEQLCRALRAGDGYTAERIMIEHVGFSGAYRLGRRGPL
ncbi:GntR family transcriptional regulator [Streptomyces sp. NBC_00483]|uniref:GntR family transcriptional regulator n=2 Tax=unclassified Streptomyces TaxID=2593676 RepID=UPI002E17CF9C